MFPENAKSYNIMDVFQRDGRLKVEVAGEGKQTEGSEAVEVSKSEESMTEKNSLRTSEEFIIVESTSEESMTTESSSENSKIQSEIIDKYQVAHSRLAWCSS